MKLATWNVNSLRVRLPHLLDWLAANSPDVVCLQETKCEDATFPAAELARGRLLQRAPRPAHLQRRGDPLEGARRGVCRGIPEFADEQSRVIAVDVDGVRVVSVYVPNGQSVGSDKYAYKLRWFEALEAWLEAELAALSAHRRAGRLQRRARGPRRARSGGVGGQVLFSEPERAALQRLIALGFVDAFRLFEQPEKSFSWWDYRMGAFRRNMGLRIDHILLSPALASAAKSCSIDIAPRKLERPSDHAPVVCELAL